MGRQSRRLGVTMVMVHARVQAWRNFFFLLHASKEEVSNFEGNSGCFGKRLDFCIQKVVADGENFGGDGERSPISKRACFEDIMDSKGVSGPMREDPTMLQKA